MRASHRCDTCQGLGCLACTGFHSCEQPHNYCPVCQGSGTLPDQMPAADALADAETFRIVVLRAARLPEFDVWIHYWSGDAKDSEIEQLASYGKELAHDVFRAVPGLRG